MFDASSLPHPVAAATAAAGFVVMYNGRVLGYAPNALLLCGVNAPPADGDAANILVLGWLSLDDG